VLLVERAASGEIAKPSTIGGRVPRADFEHPSCVEHDSHHVVHYDVRAMNAQERNRDDGGVVYAVHEIADLQ
jgi:hypothetical protein